MQAHAYDKCIIRTAKETYFCGQQAKKLGIDWVCRWVGRWRMVSDTIDCSRDIILEQVDINTYKYIYICIYVFIICIYALICVYIPIYVCFYIYIYIYRYACLYYVYIYIYRYIYIYKLSKLCLY